MISCPVGQCFFSFFYLQKKTLHAIIDYNSEWNHFASIAFEVAVAPFNYMRIVLLFWKTFAWTIFY